jgi:hypothetical protein
MENIMNVLMTKLDIIDKAHQNQIDLPVLLPENTENGTRLADLISTLEQGPVYSIPQANTSVEELRKGNTLGDAILRRMDSLGSDFRKKVDHIQEMLKVAPGTYSTHQMLQLQMEISLVSIEVEVVGKGVQKAVQHADQLTKLN